jgi:hypothetical protein
VALIVDRSQHPQADRFFSFNLLQHSNPEQRAIV